MAETKSGVVLAGAGLVWRRQRVLWWIFVANLLLAIFSIRGIVQRTGNVLDHSLAAARLVHGFDISALGELAVQPGISPLNVSPSALGYSFVFFVFMLFVTGGILEVYQHDAKLATGEFFEASGAYFWRFVRLVIFLLLCMIPLAILLEIAHLIGNRIEERAISPMASIWFRFGVDIVVVFLLMALRLWFDMAEVHAVAQNERKMLRALRIAGRLTRKNFGRLFWMYLRISIVAWAGFGSGLWLWMYVLRPEAITSALILSQLMILFWLGTRLWQRSSETLWYRQNPPTDAQPVPAPAGPPILQPAPETD